MSALSHPLDDSTPLVGQVGSEKSFLNLGEEGTGPQKKPRAQSTFLQATEDKGILIHALQSLFEEIDLREMTENKIFVVKCSYFEIYNDQVYDLLREEFAQLNEPLQVVEDRVSRTLP